MRLLIISHTAHYIQDGQYFGWGPTIKETSWLARAFDQVTHLAFLHDGPVPRNALPYEADNFKIITVPPSGGLTLGAKIRVITQGPNYIRKIINNISIADVIHVRCPGGLGLYGMFVCSFVRKKQKWIKYAGNWKAEFDKMAPSHILQREWLRLGLSHAIVTVNGTWPNQPDHVIPFLNPSASIHEINNARDKCAGKKLNPPYRIVFVGHTSRKKGLHSALEIVNQLNTNHPGRFIFDVVGDGPERSSFEEFVYKNNLCDIVVFHGWVSHSQVFEILIPAHFILLPTTTSEGWPKVLSEAMMCGVVPLASEISSIPQIFSSIGTGIGIPPIDIDIYIKTIQSFISNPKEWIRMSNAGISSAPQFSYERYLLAVDEMFSTFYGKSPLKQDFIEEVREGYSEFSQTNLNRFWSHNTL
ncbi:glycosyltransferase family 4 protein [Chloroflexota bacterium]